MLVPPPLSNWIPIPFYVADHKYRESYDQETEEECRYTLDDFSVRFKADFVKLNHGAHAD